MIWSGYRRTLSVGFLLLFPVAAVCPVEAAAPRLLIVHGKPLKKPVLLSDGREIFKLITMSTESAGITSKELKDRSYMELALFWGPDWVRYVDEGKPLDKLTPEDANQHGWFYPASAEAEAVIWINGSSINRVSEEGLKILAQHGIPTRLDRKPD
jgi:hypothetical protein